MLNENQRGYKNKPQAASKKLLQTWLIIIQVYQ